MPGTTTNAVVKFKPMIKVIAAKLASKLPPGVLLDDLMQEGMIALITAVRQSKDKGEHFTTYAYQRVQGAMLDSLRRADSAPRSLRKEVRQANTVVVGLEQKLGRRPFESEIAAAMGIQLTEYQRLLFDVYSSTLLYFDPEDDQYGHVFGVIDDGADPEGKAGRRQLIEALDWAIEALPEQLNRVVAGLYIGGKSAHELADEMRLTEGRISQLRKQAVEKLRGDLRRRRLIPD